MLEYMYLPKMLGLAERAWSKQPRWAIQVSGEEYDSALQEAWNVFANTLGQRDMPRLDYLFGGYNYRLPPPGLKIVDGVLYANSQFPGLTIRYTTDGSVPTIDSKAYSSPVRVDGAVTACTFNSIGRRSLTAILRED
jgi:hexosaminidase